MVSHTTLGIAQLGVEETDEIIDVLYFRDNMGNMIDKETALLYIDRLLKFYNSNCAEIEINNNYLQTQMLYWGINPKDIFYNTYYKEQVYYFKAFRKNLKRNWSVKCAWCSEKVSSKEHAGYWLLRKQSRVFRDYDLELDVYRACSEDCAKLLWKESFYHYFNPKREDLDEKERHFIEYVLVEIKKHDK